MKLPRIVRAATIAVSAVAIVALAGLPLVTHRVHAQEESDSDAQLVAIGLKIAPPFLNTQGKVPALVGLGSFIVNAQADCNGCHGSDPTNEFLVPGNPYLRKPLNGPMQFNQATYLNGGQNFGPGGPGIVLDTTSPLYFGPGFGPNIITRNLTPDYTGNPEGGNDLERFIKIMRTGHDYDHLHPNCSATVTDNCYSFPIDGSLLQIMPWPKFSNMTDHQLTAIWTYLSTVPCNAHSDTLGDTFPWLKNKC